MLTALQKAKKSGAKIISINPLPETGLIGFTNPGPFAIAAFGLGAGYQDEGMTFSVNYSSIYQDYGSASLTRNQTVLLQLQLRTLGDAKVTQTFLNTTALDGVKY